MLRYFFISGFVHASILGALFIPWGSSRPRQSVYSGPMTVELFLPSEVNVSKPKMKMKKSVSMQPALDRLKKESPLYEDKTKNGYDEDGSADQNQAQAQAVRLSYTQELNLFIRRNKFYPRAARQLRQTGVVNIRVEITPTGQFKNVGIESASNYERLNRAALKLVKDLKKFKPLPKELLSEEFFIIPISYQLSGGAS